MRAAVVCPGPSNYLFAECDRPHNLTLGVNRAPLLMERVGPILDGWVFLDWHVFLNYRPGYLPRVFTTREAADAVARHGKGGDLYGHPTVDLADDITDAAVPRKLGWTVYSKTAAMIYAYSLGATSIDLYGDDRQGVADSDGHTSEQNNRDASRWERESQITDDVTRWLRDRGVQVERIVP